ncbi:hypothetical protein [Kocuria sabuli]|uniref:hypothetical protein n=1 Tax=Kocuria sabuli TaxID=3071448 RepID=UPI0034D52E2C
MTCPAPPDDADAPDVSEATAPATVVDLTTGAAHITPVVVDGEARYAVDLPDQPLDEHDVASLAVALQVTQAGQAVLVDIEDYLGSDWGSADTAEPRS